MGKEIELKFQVSLHEMTELKRARFLRARSAAEKKAEKLLSVYFDTAEYGLKQEGISLRVRHAGGERIQTIKTQESGVPFSRGQWEHKIRGHAPDLRFARSTPLARWSTKHLRAALAPVFTTRVNRITRQLDEGESCIEMALDVGMVRAGRRKEPISEVELELKRGEVADLFRLAKRVGSLVPAKLAFKTKSDRGYDLLARPPPSALPAQPIKLMAGMPTAKAFQVVGRATLRHVVDNELAVRKGSSKGLHQMRVGLRKLRAAISIFSELVNDPQTKRIKTELVWLTGELGPARDLDVYIRSTVEPLRKLQPKRRGLRQFAGELVVRRKAAFKKMKVAVNSPRYRLLVLEILQWIEAGEWLKHSRIANRPVERFAADSVAHQSRKVLKKQKGLAEFDSFQLHKLRIRFKKLRYSCAFFGNLCDGRKMNRRLRRFNDCLSKMQDNLGALNDISVHKKMAVAQIAIQTSKSYPKRDFAAEFVSGREQKQIKHFMKAASKTARKLAQTPSFLIS